MTMDDGHWDTINDRDDDWLERELYQRAADRRRVAQAQEDRDTGHDLALAVFDEPEVV